MAEASTQYEVAIEIEGIPPEDLVVIRMRGREALSELFDFEVDVSTTTSNPLDLDVYGKLMTSKVKLLFGPQQQHKIHGVIRETEALPVAEIGNSHYRLRVVPKLFDSTLVVGSWVYQDLTIPEIIQEVLKEAGFEEGKDFELELTGSYPKLEYKVQYEESDFNFISRLAEYAGIFYFFKHTSDGTKAVFADANEAFQPIEGLESIPYVPSRHEADERQSIQALSIVQKMLPSKLRLNDFNYRTPSVPLVIDQPVDEEAGLGVIASYGEHYKTPDEGKKLAKIRAQEWSALRTRHRGESMVFALRAGTKFTLEGHPIPPMDSEYLVTEVVHEVEQPMSLQTRETAKDYRNRFVAMPFDTVFRPARVTPLPKIYGVMHAQIDAESDGVHAVPVDEHGRYKVVLPFDICGKPGGKASRWCRMLQVASGPGYGMHMPLHGGTEVLVVHLGGDPDRPVIAGSVANFESPSPVTSANATQSAFKSRHGISFTLTDA